ncbi:thiamine pyrophosphate-dependent dehydrogenase E1 component subunit alpha [Pasteuria penetrans]|uniref:thiamine pyrophosphate-dependent dehydrogenase E1 component subunit alpha n=1 Tax=Pasteuria penetrans TaxID=86005 RepID=UPI000FA2A2E5|nr:thiamine pyrophosphate-dependent dehydrogenase E1 component subunit alpha [Pasteuria penetrans]
MGESVHRMLGISDAQLFSMYQTMRLARTVDERLWLLNRAAKISFVVSCQGHEAVQVGSVAALTPREDWFCPYYRDLGMMLALGQTPLDAMLAAFARRDDPNSGGRQMLAHYSDRKRRVLSGSSPTATQVLHAVGIAYAMRLRKERGVVLASCGEGATSQGEFHEACNFAGVYHLPVIFLVQNNRYAISVPLTRQVAGGSIAKRAAGYGFYGVHLDGTDIFQVYRTVQEAVQRARDGRGPTLLEAWVPRLRPHSSDDDDRVYRTEVEQMQDHQQDPLPRLRQYLFQFRLASESELNRCDQQAVEQVDEAIRQAEAAPFPNPSTLGRYVRAGVHREGPDDGSSFLY